VIETDAIVGVQKSKTALNFVSLDHGFKNIADSERLSLTSKMIGYGKDRAEIIRRMSPYNRYQLSWDLCDWQAYILRPGNSR
jgi:hypothetical protein